MASDIISFWLFLPEDQFSNLRCFAMQYICRFGNTYRCEQTFSAKKIIKTKNRTCLTDNNLSNLFLLATTSLHPNIESITSQKQQQVSH